MPNVDGRAEKKSAILIDEWKREIFEKNLTEAGFTVFGWERQTGNVIALGVTTYSMMELLRLKGVIEKANKEAAVWRRRNPVRK